MARKKVISASEFVWDHFVKQVNYGTALSLMSDGTQLWLEDRADER